MPSKMKLAVSVLILASSCSYACSDGSSPRRITFVESSDSDKIAQLNDLAGRQICVNLQQDKSAQIRRAIARDSSDNTYWYVQVNLTAGEKVERFYFPDEREILAVAALSEEPRQSAGGSTCVLTGTVTLYRAKLIALKFDQFNNDVLKNLWVRPGDGDGYEYLPNPSSNSSCVDIRAQAQPLENANREYVLKIRERDAADSAEGEITVVYRNKENRRKEETIKLNELQKVAKVRDELEKNLRPAGLAGNAFRGEAPGSFIEIAGSRVYASFKSQ